MVLVDAKRRFNRWDRAVLFKPADVFTRPTISRFFDPDQVVPGAPREQLPETIHQNQAFLILPECHSLASTVSNDFLLLLYLADTLTKRKANRVAPTGLEIVVS